MALPPGLLTRPLHVGVKLPETPPGRSPAVRCQSARSRCCKINNGRLAGGRGTAHPVPGAAQPGSAARAGSGIFAAQEIKPQARVLATDRGIRCVTLDYEAMRGTEDDSLRLF
jgi:Endonuclease NucS